MKKKIAELSAKEMDSTDRDAWVDYFCSEYEIDLVVMYPESKDIDISEKTVQEYNTWYQISRDEPKFSTDRVIRSRAKSRSPATQVSSSCSQTRTSWAPMKLTAS